MVAITLTRQRTPDDTVRTRYWYPLKIASETGASHSAPSESRRAGALCFYVLPATVLPRTCDRKQGESRVVGRLATCYPAKPVEHLQAQLPLNGMR